MEEKKKRGMPSRGAAQIKYFFLETLRMHTSLEYSEFLSRGLRTKKGVNRRYPWAYLRFFVLLFVLYAVFLLIMRFTGNQLFVPVVTLLAALLYNIPFLCLMYELYPHRDISLLAILFALSVGGASACVISQVLFDLFPPSNLWLKAVYAGFFEELSKAAVIVVVIVIAKKNSPLAGMLFGAAVGCGFSVAEDLGYVYLSSVEMPSINLTAIVNITISRGLTAFCTHTLWSGLIGWAYARFSRRRFNVCNYLVLLAVCGVHICWDLPLQPLPQGFVCAACVLVCAASGIAVLACERRAAFRADGVIRPDENYYKRDKSTVNAGHYIYWKHWGHFTLALGAFLLAIISVIYCSIPYCETYGTQEFKKAEDFVAFMQDGYVFTIDNNRAYNSHDVAGNTDETRVNGVVTQITQTVLDEEVKYYYRYNVAHDDISGRDYYLLADVSVEVRSGEGAYVRYFKEDVYYGGKLYASFFHINGNVTGYNFDSDGDVTVFIYDATYVREWNSPEYIALFSTFMAVTFVSAVCYIGLTIKSRRVKKLCSTKNVSSAQ